MCLLIVTPGRIDIKAKAILWDCEKRLDTQLQLQANIWFRFSQPRPADDRNETCKQPAARYNAYIMSFFEPSHQHAHHIEC